MNTVMRCHIKNDERLAILERSIKSWYDKNIDAFGKLYLVDDGSPCQEEVESIAEKYKAEYFRTKGEPDTKNGLYWSLKVQNEFPVLCCVDDVVFGKGLYERIDRIFNRDIPIIGKFGIIGLFACYEDLTRNPNRVHGTGLWYISPSILYALVAHIFSESFSKTMIDLWDKIQTGEEPYPACCDDIWVARTLKRFNIPSYNTMKDYAQHTGVNNRTFGDNKGSEYVSKMFVGE